MSNKTQCTATQYTTVHKIKRINSSRISTYNLE